jgi:hypothetical protein
MVLKDLAAEFQRLIEAGHGELIIKGYDSDRGRDTEYQGFVYGHTDVTLKFGEPERQGIRSDA